ncbi:MAG: hypothetical protein V3T86_08895 [Planctomycetota bacterium]
MKAIFPLCVLVSVVLWAWAFAAPRAPTPVPEELVGTYKLFRYEPGPTQTDKSNPYIEGHNQVFEFHADGTYAVRQIVAGGAEMSRWEGLVLVPRAGRMEFRQVSNDRALMRATDENIEQVYRWEWRMTKIGEIPPYDKMIQALVLTNAKLGFELFLQKES